MDIGSTSVAVAMSGGLDSSMAASLLVEEGHACFGIMMRLWSEEGPGQASTNKCCSPASVEVARQVAHQLDIPFYLINVEETFRQQVVDPFILDYSHGLTPNPCLNCNRHIRFTYLLEYARRLGADCLATGHHARVVRQENGQASLYRAVDPTKDQSYVLSVLNQARLQQVLFPVGHYLKSDLRAMARQRNLPVADKQESMDLCFVADDDYRRFLRDWSPTPAAPGPVFTAEGQEVGTHQGLFHYTIGQRRGLNLPNLGGVPQYVIRKDVERNALVVGPRAHLATHSFVLHRENWIQGYPPASGTELTCQIRYRSAAVPCQLEPDGHGATRVRLTAPQSGVAAGQAAVFYTGDRCLGGGLIAA